MMMMRKWAKKLQNRTVADKDGRHVGGERYILR